MSSTYQSHLIKKVQLTYDTYAFYFERPKEYSFLPGQFLRLVLNIPKFFSIASSPTEKDHLMIVSRIRESEFKKTLLNLTAQNAITLGGPFGNFIYKPEEHIQHVFLAGGIGITPFLSMIHYAIDNKINIPITLFTSFSTTENVIFENELLEIAQKNTWFKLVQTITRPDESQKPWPGHKGRISSVLIFRHLEYLPASLFYISGPPVMVDDLGKIVKSMGVDDSMIRMEKFTGY